MGTSPLTVGGSRVSWSYWMQTNHDWETVEVASVPEATSEQIFGIEDEGVVNDLYADGDLTVFGVGDYVPDDTYRINGTKVERFAEGRPLAVDAGRVLVRRRSGRLELLDVRARLLARFGQYRRDVRAALQGRDLVVAGTRKLVVYRASSGRIVRRLPLRGLLADLHDGIAVSVAGRTIHLVRLADGRTASIEVPGRGEVLAQIESPGLTYAYTVPGSTRPGRVTLLPFAAVRGRLG